ncbi:MAG: ABC transporter ATP-binding protein [candidate division WS6 bacterium GW2011_GWC1_33_20]|uniref:ABC transporter ATP-binding protein n=1 Tax=candidate division WS6 bacterium GW2011_GWC1_33_20 TaxID=1619089 RepID=A0A0F9ZID6_9BACT|nr:MAG: ABC transporter ATP-binding protein [candidate division WS6 bacterium GW2011_GWE2_33_157]KKP43963.1 MAG: ABC transporter ATP-binding protein [candidate division WS6 bacterium GW2011_GWC1_33_20]KKP45672.1 MAG: ABC transporter ATP-binding protein [candidate division WS6 bacterium GW2011_GWF1_33_233]KKP82195.1 MAG: ABC transporter [candidate division WS6 bacterium GW2011_GWD1_35_594]
MLSIDSISISKGGKEILKDISLFVGPNEKIGLVGVNGAGKSTLLKIIAGKEESDLGNIYFNGTLSYLSQEIHKEMEGNISKELDIQENLTIGEYLILQRGLDIEEWEINKFLNNMNMKEKSSDSILRELSGGQKIKVELIRILSEKSNLLILDEPTNFLDIPSTEWLMGYLSTYPRAVLVVSHDLRLMNKSISKIWYLNDIRHNVDVYRGNYDDFIKQMSLKDELLVKTLKAQQMKAKRIYENAKALSSRGSTKEKMKAARKLELAQKEKLKAIEMAKGLVKSKKMKIEIPTPFNCSRNVLTVENISKEYIKGIPILRNVSFEVEKKEKIAIIGKNGVGKTTLLKILAGRLKQNKGKYTWGASVNLGYYSQEYEGLDYEQTVLENVYGLDWGEIDRRAFLGRFLLTGDMVNQKIKTLSGGEKTRLALAKLFAGRHNVLLLDEPTTYLDFDSQKILLSALKEYKGTILIVSHQPEFVRDLGIDKVLLMPDEKYGYFKEEYIERVGII